MPNMPASTLAGLCLVALSGCSNGPTRAEVERALHDASLGGTGGAYGELSSDADPTAAAARLELIVAQDPENLRALRGFASALSKSAETGRAVTAWEVVLSHAQASYDDRLDYGKALVRAGRWPDAEAVLTAIPPTHNSLTKFQLAAILADNKKRWKEADSAYQAAAALQPTAASVYNNWGYSNLSRGNYREAERLFMRSLQFDRTLFTTKNNLAMARAGQRNYKLPQIEMTQEERAQLIYTMALTAIKTGEVHSGKTLLREAIDSHPRHFEEAVRALRTLEG